jgi:hypothetical protein
MWAFSIWLESVAILPQLFMLQRTGEAETITTHYLFALGAYRALYIPNWIYRYFFEVPRFYDPIAVIAGIVQTILYSDFFYIYYTKSVSPVSSSQSNADKRQGHPREEVQPPCLKCSAKVGQYPKFRFERRRGMFAPTLHKRDNGGSAFWNEALLVWIQKDGMTLGSCCMNCTNRAVRKICTGRSGLAKLRCSFVALPNISLRIHVGLSLCQNP